MSAVSILSLFDFRIHGSEFWSDRANFVAAFDCFWHTYVQNCKYLLSVSETKNHVYIYFDATVEISLHVDFQDKLNR